LATLASISLSNRLSKISIISCVKIYIFSCGTFRRKKKKVYLLIFIGIGSQGNEPGKGGKKGKLVGKGGEKGILL